MKPVESLIRSSFREFLGAIFEDLIVHLQSLKLNLNMNVNIFIRIFFGLLEDNVGRKWRCMSFHSKLGDVPKATERCHAQRITWGYPA